MPEFEMEYPDDGQMGHNKPPVTLAERTDDLVETGALWFDAEDRQVITDEAMAEKLKDYLDLCGAHLKMVEKERTTAVKPLNKIVKDINEAHKGFKSTVEMLVSKLRPRLADYMKRKQDALDEDNRIKAEMVAKAEAEAAEAAKNATSFADEMAAESAAERAKAAAKELAATPTRAAVAGNLGLRAASTRVYYSADIVDRDVALAHFAKDSRLLDTLQIIANEASRNMRGEGTVPGIKLKTEWR